MWGAPYGSQLMLQTSKNSTSSAVNYKNWSWSMIMSLVLQPAVAQAASYIIVQLRSRNPLKCSRISRLNQWLHLTQLSSANGEYSSSFKSSKMAFWVYLTSLFERGPPMWISASKSAQLICSSQDQYEHAGERYIFAGWREIVSLENLLFYGLLNYPA